MFTTLAGFVEAGETFEDAVKREVYEESGMWVDDDVKYLKSQPWPFPQSSMIAFRARCDSSVPLNLDEEELVEARWFTREEVRRACKVEGPVMRPEVAGELKKLYNHCCTIILTRRFGPPSQRRPLRRTPV